MIELFRRGNPGVLALEDGTVFEGTSIGADGEMDGEVVFNTSMTGYQEILTDPSYRGQIVTMTYTQIGNYGTNDNDVERREREPVHALLDAVSDIRVALAQLAAFLPMTGRVEQKYRE